ncbi:hypothetical protein AB1L42_07515 [Thalassoglobus sp. JC818]|uniref:hypothetical protein n=1 Tax=Thalassoglobus sp. JC818 TaxID=3232136 RepID=UPI0034591527
MFSPYEELEYLADYLPEEGEMVLVSRESGELVCKPYQKDELRDGIHDAQLYGFLVQANERLHTAGALPLFVTAMLLVWSIIFIHGLVGLGWSYWYIVPGLTLPLLYGCFVWVRQRQQNYFKKMILPQLQSELQRRQIPFYALVAGIRQHSEFQTLLDEIVHWSPQSSELSSSHMRS